MEVLVNESTSVLHIDGSIAPLPMVYISTTTLADHFATIIDATGFVSKSNPLKLSTTATVTLTGGATSLSIRQPFGYLSLAAVSTNQWSVVNRDPFSVDASTIRALDTKALGSLHLSTNLVSSTGAVSDSLTAQSLRSLTGVTGNTNLAHTAAYITANLEVGPLRASTLQSASATLLDTSGTNARVETTLSIGGSISTPTIAVQSIVANQLSLSDVVTSADTDNIINLSTITASSTSASTLAASGLYLGSTLLLAGQASAISTPSLSTSTITAFTTSTSTITATFITGAMSTLQLGATVIQNPIGSATLSSLTVQSIRAMDVSGADIVANSVRLSSITMNTENPLPILLPIAIGDPLLLESSWSISTNRLSTGSMNTSNLSVVNISTNILTGDELTATTLAPALFIAESELSLAGKSFYVPLAPMTASDIQTPTVQGSSLITADLSGVDTVVSDPFATSSIVTAGTTTRVVDAAKVFSASLSATNVMLGRPVPVNPSDPYISVETFTPVNQPPFQYESGAGTFRNPFKGFLVETTLTYISLYNPSGATLYLNVKLRHTNLPPPNAGRNGWINLYINGNLVFSRLNIYEEPLLEYIRFDQNLASYPLTALNPITGDTTPYVVWEVNAAGVTTDQLTLWISNNTTAVDSVAPSSLDPTGGITVRRGILQWPSTIYGTAIQNEFNDIETRSLLYTGSLQNVSDPALKRDLGAADLSACVAAAQIPLHTYAYRPDFASTFQIQDRRRLGILTTELKTRFPHSVTTETVLGASTEVASMDQMRYAHLGATKYLMAEVQRLRQKLLNS